MLGNIGASCVCVCVCVCACAYVSLWTRDEAQSILLDGFTLPDRDKSWPHEKNGGTKNCWIIRLVDQCQPHSPSTSKNTEHMRVSFL